MATREQELRQNMAQVNEDVAEAARVAGRQPGEVQVLAVSKLHQATDIATLFEDGQRLFGENYVQEVLSKQDELEHLDIDWHFIGGLQSNKAKYVAGRFDLIHSVDSRKLAHMLHKKALSENVMQKILLQVNISGETQKSGITEQSLAELAEDVESLEKLECVGLMTMPPFFDDPERARPVFARLRELRDSLEIRLDRKLPHLSMGMTGDFIPAIEEGATLVRIGTRIFGRRPAR